jgi:outer membrane protein W
MEEPALTIGLDINVEKTKYINTSISRQQDAHTKTVNINGQIYQEVTD